MDNRILEGVAFPPMTTTMTAGHATGRKRLLDALCITGGVMLGAATATLQGFIGGEWVGAAIVGPGLGWVLGYFAKRRNGERASIPRWVLGTSLAIFIIQIAGN